MIPVLPTCPTCGAPLPAFTPTKLVNCNSCTKSTTICPKCNIASFTCAICKSTACTTHLAGCAGCGKLVCSQCAKSCAACAGRLCPGCGTHCYECGNFCCANCSADCAVCAGTYCKTCCGDCFSCTIAVCETDRMACTRCNQKMCTTHAVSFPLENGQYCPSCFNKELKSRKLGRHEVVVGCPFKLDEVEVDDTALDRFGIKLMTYAEGKKKRKKAAQKKNSPFKGKQLEHLLPNSNMVSGPGRKAKPVIGAKNYSEDGALIMTVDDDQSQGTEHKFLTDRERAIDKELDEEGKYATVEQKTRMMVAAWKEDFKTYHKKNYTGTDIEKDSEQAAIALGQKLIKHNKRKLKIDEDTPTRNGIVKNAEPPKKKLKKSQVLDF